MLCCWCFAVVALLLLLCCCWCAVVALLLLLCCCWCAVVALLMLFCWCWGAVDVLLLLLCCCWCAVEIFVGFVGCVGCGEKKLRLTLYINLSFWCSFLDKRTKIKNFFSVLKALAVYFAIFISLLYFVQQGWKFNAKYTDAFGKTPKCSFVLGLTLIVFF